MRSALIFLANTSTFLEIFSTSSSAGALTTGAIFRFSYTPSTNKSFRVLLSAPDTCLYSPGSSVGSIICIVSLFAATNPSVSRPLGDIKSNNANWSSSNGVIIEWPLPRCIGILASESFSYTGPTSSMKR